MSIEYGPLFDYVSLDNNGKLNVGGTVNWYYEGTSNPAPAYNESDLPISQPFVIGSDGRVPFKLDVNFGYRIVIKNSLGSTLVDRDNIFAATGSGTTSPIYKVLTTSTDTSPGYLLDKISVGSNLTLTSASSGGNETFEIDLATSAGTLQAVSERGNTTNQGIVITSGVNDKYLELSGTGMVRIQGGDQQGGGNPFVITNDDAGYPNLGSGIEFWGSQVLVQGRGGTSQIDLSPTYCFLRAGGSGGDEVKLLLTSGGQAGFNTTVSGSDPVNSQDFVTLNYFDVSAANWDSTYTTVNSNSANWDNSLNTLQTVTENGNSTNQGITVTSGDIKAPNLTDIGSVYGSYKMLVANPGDSNAFAIADIGGGGGGSTSASAGAGTLQTCHLTNANGVIDFGGGSTQYPRYSYIASSNDALSIDKMKVYAYSVTGSVEYEFGLYQDTGSNLTKLLSKTVTISATGLQDIAFDTQVDLTAGITYYVGAIRQTTSGSCQLAMEAGLSTDVIGFQGAGITTPFALPSTETTKTALNYNIWAMLYSSSGGGANVGSWTTVTVTTSAFQAGVNNFVLCDTTSGDIVVTLPTASINSNKEVVVKKISSDTNSVIVSAQGSENVDDLTSRDLEIQYSSISVVSNGTDWWIR